MSRSKRPSSSTTFVLEAQGQATFNTTDVELSEPDAAGDKYWEYQSVGYVVKIDRRMLDTLACRAAKNKSGKAVDGPLSIESIKLGEPRRGDKYHRAERSS